MNNNIVRRRASDFLKKYSIGKLNLDKLLSIFKNQGFDIIEYKTSENSESVNRLISALSLEKYISEGKAITYKSDDIKLIFVCEDLTAEEKLYALAHEEGHIFCGHLRDGNVFYSIEEEQEANEFAHYVLHPSTLRRVAVFIKENKKIATATILLALVVVIMIPSAVHVFTSKDAPVYTETHNGYYYVTQSGTKYHLGDCAFINGRKKYLLSEFSLKSQNYQPCKVCLPNG